MLKKKTAEITSYNEYPYLVYARASSGKDSQKETIPNQIDICRYWLEQNNFEWDDESIFMDKDKSGTLFLERAAMQLILQKARNREIKMVVFKSIHRLARDLKDALDIKEVLIGHGVRVVTVEEGFDSLYEGKNDMKFEMHSMFAAQLPKTLSVSISSALAAKVRRGEHIGKVPYGYERVDQKLVIKEDEAAVIRQIYAWYNDGIGFKTITRYLNEGLARGEFLPPKTKDQWQITSIQRIIKNSTFCGTLILNQYTTIKVNGRKKQIKNPEEKWSIFENHHPGIITKEEWLKANSKKVTNKKTRITPWNEFRGLLKCGKCRSNMVIVASWRRKKDGTKTNWPYLKCSAYRRGGIDLCENHVPILYEDFRKFILDILNKKGEQIALNFSDSLEYNKKHQATKLKRHIDDLKNQHKTLLDLILSNLISEEEFTSKRNELEKNIKDSEDRLFLLNQKEVNHKTINNIKEAFDEIQKRDHDLFHALQVLINEIRVHIDGEIDIDYNFHADS
ncbi:recombinase family protein [Oceanobacillus kapialis]|uniref:Recombinase family protein n=1 Tax=Oceanobacillus kapialis TaxID=481353 RepID=A0ABW5PZS2_9BACI